MPGGRAAIHGTMGYRNRSFDPFVPQRPMISSPGGSRYPEVPVGVEAQHIFASPNISETVEKYGQLTIENRNE